MDKVVISISIILVIYLFYNLIKIRWKNDKKRLNVVYVLIVMILALIVVWNIFRQ